MIRRANKPFLDENGFWVDLDVTYSGKFKMTIETKVNLLKLKKPVSAQPSLEKEEKHKYDHTFNFFMAVFFGVAMCIYKLHVPYNT